MAGGAVVSGGSGGNPLRHGFIKREYLWAFILVTSLFFLWGFAYGLLDVLNAHFRAVLGITKTQSTGLQAAYFGIGYFAFSPVAGEVLKRRGYKFTIIMGLMLYSLGAILFWPCAKFSGKGNNAAVFGGFVICTAVIACGLATLEVSANSYVSVMPPHNVANFRLQFSQSFNGVASFTGPLIASKYFFSGEHNDNLDTVQWVYLAVALLGVIVAVAFFFTKLPEVSEEALQAEAELLADSQGADPQTLKPFYKQYRAISGAVAQFLYVGAQVTIGAFFLFLAEEAGINHEKGSQLLSYGLITFTVARFIGTALLSFIAAPVLLGVYAVACTIIAIMIGAVFPPMQGAISDKFDTRVSFFIVVPCFVYIALWAVYIWHKDGRRWGVASDDAVLNAQSAQLEATPDATILYQGTRRTENYEGSIKEDLTQVEKV